MRQSNKYIIWGLVKKIRNFHSSRRGKPLQVPRFPVTSVTIHMLLKRGWGNTKGWKSQLENLLQSSSPSSPESLRQPTSCSSALAVSPTEDSTRAIPCNNCDEDTSPNHICPTYIWFWWMWWSIQHRRRLHYHEWIVHPNMCHICFKFSVDWSSYLTHFHQEHLSNESSVWFSSKWLYFDLTVTYMPVRRAGGIYRSIQIVWFWSWNFSRQILTELQFNAQDDGHIKSGPAVKA